MTEKLQTRTEHSRSLEDAELLKAIYTLTELGALIPLKDADLYHGRMRGADEVDDWVVDPNHDNGHITLDNGMVSGSNINKRATLYIGDRQDADEFATERFKEIVDPIAIDIVKEQVRRLPDNEKLALIDDAIERRREQWETMSPSSRQWWVNGVDTDVEPPEEYLKAYVDIVEHRANDILRALSPEEEADLRNQAAAGRASETHKVTVHDTDATVINYGLYTGALGEADKIKFYDALRTLSLPLTEGSPVDFGFQEQADTFEEALRSKARPNFTTDQILELAQESGVDEAVALQLGSAFNAQQIALKDLPDLANLYLSNRNDIGFRFNGLLADPSTKPLNFEYARQLFRNAHIVGVLSTAKSATIGREVKVTSLFDLEGVTTEAQAAMNRQQTTQQLGEIAHAIGFTLLPSRSEKTARLNNVLQDAHAKPDTLVSAAREIPGYDEIFDADAGNWERFTLAEHTETVLRNFDENYAETLPVVLLAPMRLALIGHDLGKPAAVANGDKHLEKKYNAQQAADFFDKLGVPPNTSQLLLSIIGEGAELVFRADVLDEAMAVEKLQAFAKESLVNIYGSLGEQPEAIIAGFIALCRMVQLCDGGAYTSMAITRRGDTHFRNAPSFNPSFTSPGYTKRKLKLRKRGEDAAPDRLSPRLKVDSLQG